MTIDTLKFEDLTEQGVNTLIDHFSNIFKTLSGMSTMPELWPIKADTTKKTIRNWPGYEAFCEFDPETKYLFFLSALSGSIRAQRTLKAMIDDLKTHADATARPQPIEAGEV